VKRYSFKLPTELNVQKQLHTNRAGDRQMFVYRGKQRQKF